MLAVALGVKCMGLGNHLTRHLWPNSDLPMQPPSKCSSIKYDLFWFLVRRGVPFGVLLSGELHRPGKHFVTRDLLARILTTFFTQDYYGLPQNTSRPGGEVVGVTITPNANKSVQFHLISDRHSATEVKNAIQGNCSSVTVGEPTAFNSTNGVRPDTVVQFYRGDSAAILLQGYDNTREMPGRPDLVPNPPFPSSVNMSTWTCLNYTIGESIPLMNSASTLFDSTTFLVFFSILFLRKILDL